MSTLNATPLTVGHMKTVAQCDALIEGAGRVLADLRNSLRVQSGDYLGGDAPEGAEVRRLRGLRDYCMAQGYAADALVYEAALAKHHPNRQAVADHVDRMEQMVQVVTEARSALVAREAKRGTQPSNPMEGV